MTGKHGAPLERFFRFVDSSVGNVACWEWLGNKLPTGYGMLNIGGANEYAHRLSHILFVGPIPSGMEIDHMCHNRSCVNPKHLRLATREENQQNKTTGRSRFNGGALKGSFFDPARNKWRAAITHKGHQKFLGRFATEAEAHDAYCKAATKLFGKFANHGSKR